MKQTKFLISTGLFLGAIWVTYVNVRPAVEPVEYYSSCPTGGERVDVDVESSFSLVDSELARSEKFLEESIRHHVAFLKTHLKEQVEATGANIAFTDLEPEVLFSSATKSKWLQTTVVKAVPHKDVELTSEYLRSLIGHTVKAGADADQIQYRARFGVWLCGAKNQNEWALTGPRDPWLVHWMGQKSYAVKWRSSEFQVPAFVDDEYADIPHPEYTWYFWKPDTPRAAHEVAAFTPGHAFVTKRVGLRSIDQFSDRFLPANPDVKATVVFGIIDPKQHPWSLADIAVKTGGRTEWSKIVESLSEWSDWTHGDRGSNYAFRFLESTPELFAGDFQFSLQDGILVVNGALKESRKPFRINFYFGPTDVLAGEPPRHWDVAREGLLHDDLVFYVGHSGLGQNFAWSNMNGREPASFVPDRHRLIGVFSCYSADYFEQDLSRFMNQSSVLVLTGSNYTSARGPLGMIEWTDRMFARTHRMGTPPRIEPNDFLIFKSTQTF